nr:hypothetical protein [Thermoleophilaceae bacterium]
TIELDRPDDAEALIDLFSSDVHELNGGSVKLDLKPHDFRWLRVRRPGRRRPP